MPKLKTDIEVSALLRRAQGGGAFGAVLRKGDPQAGAYMVITRAGGELYLYRAARNMDFERIWWAKGPLEQAQLDADINRYIDNDPDVWIVEIEDKNGRHFLIEPVENTVNSDTDNGSNQAAALAAIKAVFPDR